MQTHEPPGMNYILQINAFWKQWKGSGLKPIDAAVYFTLLHLQNLSGWEKLICTRADVMNELGMTSKETYYNSIKRLTDSGFIIYESGLNQFDKPEISIIPLYRKPDGTRTEISTAPVPIQGQQKNAVPIPPKKPDGTRTESGTPPVPDSADTNKHSKPIKLKTDIVGTSDEVRSVGPIKFSIPSIDDVKNYMIEKKNFHISGAGIFSEKFWNFYNSNGWKVGKNPMKNWHSAVGTWLSDGEYRSFVKKDSAPPVTLAQMATENPGHSAQLLTKPAPVAISKDQEARQTYRNLLIKIRRENKFSEWEIWENLWLHLTNKGRTKNIPQKEKDRIQEKVKSRLTNEAQKKANSTADLLMKKNIMSAALEYLNFQCKREFCIEYFTKLIKPSKNG